MKKGYCYSLGWAQLFPVVNEICERRKERAIRGVHPNLAKKSLKQEHFDSMKSQKGNYQHEHFEYCIHTEFIFVAKL